MKPTITRRALGIAFFAILFVNLMTAYWGHLVRASEPAEVASSAGRSRAPFLLMSATSTLGAQQIQGQDYVARMKALGLPSLSGKVLAYYSPGYRQHAESLRAAIADMNAFFQERLGVQTNVVLALLDSKGWTDVTGNRYGLPSIGGIPTVILMPATSDSPAFGLMMARKEAVPPEMLQAFLKNNHTTFEAVADQFVDLIGFHELGHALTFNFGIDPINAWLDEFLASYWSYAYISERQPAWKRVFDLLGRPSKVRPKNTSLEDFERLYTGVDDYGWYQGMFEARIREIYPELGLRLLSDLRKEFPRSGDSPGAGAPASTMQPTQVLNRLEKIAPGFEKWALGFRTGNRGR